VRPDLLKETHVTWLNLSRSPGDRSVPARTRARRLVAALVLALVGTVCGSGLFSSAAQAAGGRAAMDPGSATVQRVATGSAHTCVLNAGEVRCWGKGSEGRLGYGNSDDVGDDEEPAAVGPVDLGGTAISIAAGDAHTCALMEDHTVRCWGRGDEGQLGYGNSHDIGDDETPASLGPVSLGRPALAISAGGDTTCALLNNGSIRCWGLNSYGQLGQGNTSSIGDVRVPSDVPGIDLRGPAISVSVGSTHVCAVLSNGLVRCWGNGADGRLGLGNTQNIGDNEKPAQAPALLVSGEAVAVSAGAAHTCALLDKGTVECWGSGADGRLGYGGTANVGDRLDPFQAGPVPLGREAIAVSAGGAHSCALLDNGTTRCWGADDGVPGGSADSGNPSPASAIPAVDLGDQAVEISAGDSHTCARLADGTLRCWGDGGSGRLGYPNSPYVGDDETPAQMGPVLTGAPHEVLAVAAGGAHTCALRDDGTVVCWGRGADGELGQGSTGSFGDSTGEVPAKLPPIDLGGEAKAIAAGNRHTCALLADGRVVCWGDGADGRLGHGNTHDIGDNETPASVGPVELGHAAAGITAGGAHTCALLSHGLVRCWGLDSSGQLGDKSTLSVGDNELPTARPTVALGDEVRQVVAGGDHTCALLSKGGVRCWGLGANGRLGYGNTKTIGDDELPTSVPRVSVGDGREVVGVTAGTAHTCAVLDDGSARCWGKSYLGRLGYGWFKPKDIGDDEKPSSKGPIAFDRGTPWLISAGDEHTCAVIDEGTLRCWGGNDDGELGYAQYKGLPTNPDFGPVNVGPRRVTAVSTGSAHTCALLTDGSVRCWGSGADGRLGYGSTDTIGITDKPADHDPVQILPSAPVAVDDAVTVAHDSGATTIDALANDTRPDGQVVQVLAIQQPVHGKVHIVDNGAALSYQPTPGYCTDAGEAPDSFDYAVTGGSFATVRVTVTCDIPPVAQADAATTDQDVPVVIDVLANDTDADGGPKAVESVTQSAHGSAELVAGGIRYTPSAGYCNDPGGTPDEFTYSLNGGSTASVAVDVVCPPPAPVDTTPPETTITTKPNLLTVSLWLHETGMLAFTSSEAGSTFECSVDGRAFAPCTSPTALHLASGSHTFSVRARDAAGNADPTPAMRRITVFELLPA
jgi:alpha-tubulin suppressor-like RCC1 family protein